MYARFARERQAKRNILNFADLFARDTSISILSRNQALSSLFFLLRDGNFPKERDVMQILNLPQFNYNEDQLRQDVRTLFVRDSPSITSREASRLISDMLDRFDWNCK